MPPGTATAPARNDVGSARDDAPGAQQVARSFVIALHSSLRAIRLYPMENAAVRNSLVELEGYTAKVFSTFAQCELRAVGEYLFVNDTRLRLQLDNYAAVAHVLGRMQLAGVGGVVVKSKPDARAWVALLNGLLQPAVELSQAERVERLVASLEVAGVSCFVIEVAVEDDEADLDIDDEQERARQTFMRSLDATRDLLTGARMGRSPSLKKAKRAVQGIVDCIMADSTSLVGLTTLREFDDYTFVHSVNVCILAVALGRRIGLGKLQLLDLGLAALMHDIGKSRVPLELLNKRGQLDEVEYKVLQTHTWRGVLALFGMKGSAARSWRAMTTAYEHHMRVDLSGYPQPIRARQPALFSKIVAIADGFDAATTSRVYQPKPWTPADVVRGMRENPKLGFDPVLVKAFINLTGIYPIGTVVGLDTMEIALVQVASTDPNALARPSVRIIFDARGNRVDGPVVSLTERNASGGFLRTITRTENPDRYGIRVSDYFA